MIHTTSFYTCDNCGNTLPQGQEPVRFKANMAKKGTHGYDWYFDDLCQHCAGHIEAAIGNACEKAAGAGVQA